MGYTHFDKVSGENGVFKGAKGSEVEISSKNEVLLFSFLDSSAAQTMYNVVPYAANIVDCYTVSLNTVTTSSVVCKVGSAGTTLVTAAHASPGTIGVAQTSSITSAAVTVGSTISAVRGVTGSTGASYVALVLTKTGA